MSQYIQNLINTKGWKEIEKMFDETVLNCSNENIPEDMPSKEYKINSLANIKTAKNVRALLNKIKLAGGVFHKDKQTYI